MRTRKGSDFIVGLVTLIALIVLVAGVLWLKGEGFAGASQTYTVIFPQVGGLQEGDPVTVNGLRIGTVSDISLHEDNVLAVLALQQKLSLTSASKVVVVETGLLGEKKVEIFLSVEGSPIKAGPDTFIVGEYRGGIAEAASALGVMAHEITTILDTLHESLIQLAGSLQGEKSLVTFLDTLVTRLDTITATTERIVVTNENNIRQILKNVYVITEESRTLLSENKEGVTAVIANADTLALEMRAVLQRLDHVVAEIDTGDGLLSELINNSTLSENIVGSLQELDSLVDDLRDEGVKVRVRLGHRDRNKDKE